MVKLIIKFFQYSPTLGPDERLLRGREALVRPLQRAPTLRRDLLQDRVVGQPTGGAHRERPERLRPQKIIFSNFEFAQFQMRVTFLRWSF